MFNPRRRHGGGFALGLLLMEVMQFGTNNIPPVTLFGLVGQVAIFLNLLNLRMPSVSDVCVSATNVFYKQEWQRLFMAPFFHLGEWHLYFNMTSFMWKGKQLEPHFGSRYYAYLLSVFAVLTSIVMVGLAMVAEVVLQDSSYVWKCAAGFSGVLFAMKVVSTHISPGGRELIMGYIPVQSRYVCWAELILIQIIVPNASFIGHLAGILVGLAYVKGPLKYVMDTVFNAVASAQHRQYRGGWRHPTSRNQDRGGGRSTGYRDSQNENAQAEQMQNQPSFRHNRASNHVEQDEPTVTEGASAQNMDLYTAGMSEDDQLQHALSNSIPTTSMPVQPSAPPEECLTGTDSVSSDVRSPTLVTPPPTGPPPEYNGLYPTLTDGPPETNNIDIDELRRRRLARLNKPRR